MTNAVELFDESRLVREDGMFEPLTISSESGHPASKAIRINPASEIALFHAGGQRGAVVVDELAYHHVIRGVFNGQPFALGFCVMCHAGVQLNPRVGDQLLTLELGGLYNGMAILKDVETGTYWELMTGTGLHGPLQGQ